MKVDILSKLKSLKSNKILLALLVVACVVALADVAYIAFVVFEVIKIARGITLYSEVVTAISIAALAVNGAFAMMTTLYLILRKK